MGSDIERRIRNVTAVLGPTNTGKTHLAIERMLGHETGLIGLPLRLLAREVYDKIVGRVGAARVALITGEEKIKPEGARYWVCTVEAMPPQIDVDFLAVDEVQLAADPERGHVFTDRLLHARGKLETLLLGAGTMRDVISDVMPGANFISRPRLSKLAYAGQKKITRLPARTAVIAFSAGEVYEIAELIRRQRGGAAVVLGALSPRTRNAQVALYQSGDVEFLVATDAIGMGLNLDVDHIAFSAVRKFDGQVHRNLLPAELAQIAGRAGRHMRDGTFGVTGDVEPFDHDLIDRLETHAFEPIKTLQWRSSDLDFASIDALHDSLRRMPRETRLMRARLADDIMALEAVSRDADVRDLASTRAAVELLWDVCQVPDYRKISSQNHAELVAALFKFIGRPGEHIPEDWFAKQVEQADRTDGDIDTLANRLAHIRTWTFVSNRQDWLKDPEHWQGRTKAIEDTLSDALHELLAQRFVDRRTSALMKGMRDKDELAAEIADDGGIRVENHFVGRLKGFRFTPDTQAEGIHGKATRHAAAQVLAKELGMRTRRVAAAKSDAFKLTRQGRIVWRDEEIARVEAGDNPLKPQVVLLADEHLGQADRDKVQERLNGWIAEIVAERLKPLVEIAEASDIAGLARGIAFRLVENFGSLKRETVADEIKTLDQTARAQLRKYGVRFGAFNVYVPLLLKPASADLASVLWALKQAPATGLTIDALPEPPRPGLTSAASDPAIPEAFYRVRGYHLCGARVVRVDMLERLADLIRPLLAWRSKAETTSPPPKGATGDGGFTVIPEMTSILGCRSEELHGVLKALDFWHERRPVKPAPPVAPEPAAPNTTTDAAVATPEGDLRDGDGGEVVVPESSSSEVASAPATEETATADDTSQIIAPDQPVEDEPETRAAVEATSVSQLAPPESLSVEPVAATVPSPAPANGAEPQFEDVWRPRRRKSRDEAKRPRRRGWTASAKGELAAQAPSDAVAVAAEPSSQPPRNPERGGYRAREPAVERRNPERGGYRAREGVGEGERKDADRGREGRDRAGERRAVPRPADTRRHRDERSQPVTRATGPAAKSAGVDPDSPFAKLGALKQELEKRAREAGTT